MHGEEFLVRHYNIVIVLVGAILLGASSGVVGVFPFLRRRAMVSEAVSHATLPGIALAFLTATALGADGKTLSLLVLGAAATGLAGILAVQWIRDHTRLSEDTAIASVLSVSYGFGVVLLSHIQTLPGGSQSGLNSFLLGSLATMTAGEAGLIGACSLAAVVVVILFLKEFGALAFDEAYVVARGWKAARLDLAMLVLVVAVVVIGLKTVGLILIIALLIAPPVSARFWTDRLVPLVAVSGLFGGVACGFGALVSAMVPHMPGGPAIVLSSGVIFVISLLFAPRRGLINVSLDLLKLRLAIARHRALLAIARGAPLHRERMAAVCYGYVDLLGNPTPKGARLARLAAENPWPEDAPWGFRAER